MIKRSFFLLSTAALLFGSANVSIASGSFPNTHTQHTPKLKPASLDLDNSFQIASVCFLGGGTGCGDGGFNKGNDDMTIDTSNQCKQEGYDKTSCALPTYLNTQCPYNSAYYAKCVTDNDRACKESGYTVTSCATGEIVESSCPYNSSYKKCKCNPCSGYDYTYAQATSQGYVTDGSCQSCSTTKYKRKNNPCSGYQTCECGGASGASVCYSGTVQKFNSCKSCDPCPGYYACGGTWQYCTGTTCYADSSRCSTYCAGDYFPNSCSSASNCNGIYRNGYCSGSCNSSSSGSSYSFNCCNDTLDPRGCATYGIGFYHTCKSLSGNPDCSPYINDCERNGGSIVYTGCDGIRTYDPNYQPTWTNYFSCQR